MRRFFHFIFGAVLFLLLIAAGIFIATAAFDTALWEKALEFCSAQRLEVLAGAGIVVLLIALHMSTGTVRRKDDSMITFENDGGSVSVSIRALQDSLAHIGSEFAAILDMRPRVRGVGNSLDVEMDVKVRSGTQIPELCRLLQARVRECVQGELGLMDVKTMRVNVREIVMPPPEKGKAQSSEEGPVEWEASIRP